MKSYKTLQAMARKTVLFQREINNMGIVQSELLDSGGGQSILLQGLINTAGLETISCWHKIDQEKFAIEKFLAILWLKLIQFLKRMQICC